MGMELSVGRTGVDAAPQVGEKIPDTETARCETLAGRGSGKREEEGI
jgi:hypothetical protein